MTETKLLVEIQTDFPPAELNPNVKAHYMKKAKIGKREKAKGYYQAKEAIGFNQLPSFPKYMMLELFIYPPDNRRHDNDNIFSALKWWLDGMCEALGIDDNQFIDTRQYKLTAASPGKIIAAISAAEWGYE
jgi:Holliday junction resolvase RusA-like endonuclease